MALCPPRNLHPRARLLWPAAALALALLPGLQGCSDDEEALPLRPGPVTEIEILLDEAPISDLELAAGESREIEAGGLDSHGRDNEAAEITATSSDESVVTVSGGASASRVRLAHSGFDVSGVAEGTATITFRDEGSGVTADLDVTVTAP